MEVRLGKVFILVLEFEYDDHLHSMNVVSSNSSKFCRFVKLGYC